MLRHSTNERQTLIKRTLDRLESVGKTVNAKNIPAKIFYSSNIRERERENGRANWEGIKPQTERKSSKYEILKLVRFVLSYYSNQSLIDWSRKRYFYHLTKRQSRLKITKLNRSNLGTKVRQLDSFGSWVNWK